MIGDGCCVVDDVLTGGFLQELRDESERLMEHHVMADEFRYQGQHVGVQGRDNEVIQRLLEWPASRRVLEQVGFADFESTGGIIILTKDPGEPALYWHQDWMQWNDPFSCSPWPQTVFLSYYLSDTSVENGCLKVIPGSHLKRHELHDRLVPAHEKGARFIDEDHPVMFSDHPDQARRDGEGRVADHRRRPPAALGAPQPDRRAPHPDPGLAPAADDGAGQLGGGRSPRSSPSRDPGAEYEGSRIPGEYLV